MLFRSIARLDKNDLIYKTEMEKFKAVIEEIKRANANGQPVLVGTVSIEKSEFLHSLLKKEKIAHSVLNAKNHEKEAQIIQNAGVKGAVTIATNMAGRGVDIKLGEGVKELGGLYIIATERHESRRIDNQLRGRAGRQGDPGESRFYLSLEDNLLRIFGSDRIKAIMERLGIEEGESIESRMVTRAVENAQKKVEGLHFESRKHLLEYDDVANEQRKTIYNFRNDLLNPNYEIGKKVEEIRSEYLDNLLSECGIFDGGIKEEYELDKLANLLASQVGYTLEIEDYKGLECSEVLAKLDGALKDEYEQKMAVAPSEQRSEIERILYLQVLDTAWREHLYQMDILKTGIGLRGYNQKDPLTEYKKESYNLFVELVERVKNESIRTLQRVQLKQESAQEEQARIDSMLKNMDENQNAGAYVEQSDDFVGEKKPQRNDPCPCGSGKKYKLCHGKSGPKKGLLA